MRKRSLPLSLGSNPIHPSHHAFTVGDLDPGIYCEATTRRLLKEARGDYYGRQRHFTTVS